MTQAEIDRLRRVFDRFCGEWPVVANQLDDMLKWHGGDDAAVVALLSDVITAISLHNAGLLYDDLAGDSEL